MHLSSELPLVPESASFLPTTFPVNQWREIQVSYDHLLAAPLDSVSDLEQFLLRANALQAVLSESEAWYYVKAHDNHLDTEAKAAYKRFHQVLKPKIMEQDRLLYQKVLACPFLSDVSLAGVVNFQAFAQRSLGLFDEINEQGRVDLQLLLGRHSEISADVKITYQNQELDLASVVAFLQVGTSDDRREVWQLMQARRSKDSHTLQSLFVQLCSIRQSLARKAGFDTYVAYSFEELGRVDYDPNTCFAFHEAVEKYVTPVFERMMATRAAALGVDKMRPWDLQALPADHVQLKPFHEISDLLEKTSSLFEYLDPTLGDLVPKIHQAQQFYLTPRPHKSPGAFSFPMWHTGAPLIFMSADGAERDLVSFMHECGHALHFLLMQDMPLKALVPLPRELAELAAMTMELLAMEHYGLFYPNPQHLNQARENHLYRVISVLPMVATLDAFQHWLYTSPAHQSQDRNAKWRELYLRFHGEAVDWSGFEDELGQQWLLYNHLFEAPFYSIEYGFAQIGALMIWNKYRNDPSQTIAQYLEALKMGYTASAPEIYEAAGASFSFSGEQMKAALEAIT